MAPLPVSFYRRPAETVAQDLLGRWLVRRVGGRRLILRLVETEAYLGAPDAASHAAGGHRSERVQSLYLAGGHAYVYLIYGIHHCLNAVTGEADVGSAVLIRAGEPVDRLPWRPAHQLRDLTGDYLMREITIKPR